MGVAVGYLWWIYDVDTYFTNRIDYNLFL